MLALRSEISDGVYCLVFYTVHFYYISGGHLSIFEIALCKDVESQASRDYFLCLAGDLNVAKAGTPGIDHHFPLASTVPRSNYGSAAKSVNEIFSFLTEVTIDEPTHFSSGTGRLSYIDRAAFACPSWATTLFSVSFLGKVAKP